MQHSAFLDHSCITINGPGEYDLKRNIYLGHQPNEYVTVENLEKATSFFSEFAKTMLG